MVPESKMSSAEEREIEKEERKGKPIKKKPLGDIPKKPRENFHNQERINRGYPGCRIWKPHKVLDLVSSSEIIRSPGSIISKAPLKALSFVIFNKKSAVQEGQAPVYYKGNGPPPGSEYGSVLRGTQDIRVTGASRGR
ncbi:hypothetical protein F2Q70_00004124 [Brassica cretica]|uniref:Uncharacterized protein n=1 Tax=Brassica cretica TaxID=69181 RepID=A0A8S9J206_BRACR|nr:hypothetical protein F2Q70_00004124 [Brassica cretica]